LDIGCGDGSLAWRLADRFGIVVAGIDRNRAMIERAQMKTLNPRVQFVETNFMQYDVDDRFLSLQRLRCIMCRWSQHLKR